MTYGSPGCFLVDDELVCGSEFCFSTCSGHCLGVNPLVYGADQSLRGSSFLPFNMRTSRGGRIVTYLISLIQPLSGPGLRCAKNHGERRRPGSRPGVGRAVHVSQDWLRKGILSWKALWSVRGFRGGTAIDGNWGEMGDT